MLWFKCFHNMSLSGEREFSHQAKGDLWGNLLLYSSEPQTWKLGQNKWFWCHTSALRALTGLARVGIYTDQKVSGSLCFQDHCIITTALENFLSFFIGIQIQHWTFFALPIRILSETIINVLKKIKSVFSVEEVGEMQEGIQNAD